MSSPLKPDGEQDHCALDRELAYAGSQKAIVTGQYRGASWLFTIDLTTGTRTPLTQGSQPSVAR